MQLTLPSTAGCAGAPCVGARQHKPVCPKRRLYRQLGISQLGDELRTFARGRKRGTVLSEDLVLAPYPPCPDEPSEGGASSPGETQQRRQTINSLSALLTALPPRPHTEPSSTQSSREQDMKKRQHAGLKGMLDVLFEEDLKHGRQQQDSSPQHHAHADGSSRVHQRHAVVRRQEQMRAHDASHVKAEEAAAQQPAEPVPAPEARPTANRLYTMMRKQGSSLAALMEFVHHHNDELGTKHCVLAYKLAANIFSQQCGGGSSSSSSVDHRCSGSSMDPLEAEALSSLVSTLDQRLSSSVEELDPRQTAILLWSMGSMELRGAALLPALLQHVRPMLGELGPGELSSVVWGCARLGADSADAGFLEAWEAAAIGALTSGAAGSVPEVRGSAPGGGNNRQYLELMTENQQLVNMAWALAVLNRYNSSLFQQLLSTYSRRLHTLQAPLLVTILWAMNKVGHLDPAFAHQALAQIRGQARTFKAKHLAMLISSLVGMMDTAEEGGGVTGSSRSPGGDARGLTRGGLQQAVAELQWKVLRRGMQLATLEAFGAAEVVDAMRAVVLLNEQSSFSSATQQPAGHTPAGRRFVNSEWQQQQQAWQQKWQHELADSSRPFDRRFSPVVLTAYNDVLLLRLLMDRAVGLLPDLRPSELLQLLCVCARVGFTPRRLEPEAVKQLRTARSRMSAADLQVLSWALASVGFEDEGHVVGARNTESC